MTWYTGLYGSWTKGDCRVHYLEGTYNRKEMFARAQEVANEKNEVVTILAETGSVSGLRTKIYKVTPQ